MLILAIDLGKFKSVACIFDTISGEHGFTTLPTTPTEMHDLLAERSPDRVVFEVGSQAGWLRDLCEALGVEFQIANPSHEAWRWKSVKRKTDRDDALKLARLSAVDQLPTVILPGKCIREWRALIAYRTALVRRRTAIRNGVGSMLDRQGLPKPRWTLAGLAELRQLAKPLPDCGADELWRGMLSLELAGLRELATQITEAEAKLEEIARADERVAPLRTIPGVGPRLSEAVVAVINDPSRFRSGRQVGAYAGLVPRQFQSGTVDRRGGITGAGHSLLRTLLVEVAWLARQHNSWLNTVYEQTCRGTKARRKIAVVAAARRLLVVCWAMLRDGTPWRDPAPA
jgi:transposase